MLCSGLAFPDFGWSYVIEVGLHSSSHRLNSSHHSLPLLHVYRRLLESFLISTASGTSWRGHPLDHCGFTPGAVIMVHVFALDSCVSSLKLKELLPQIFSVDSPTRPVRLSGLKSWQCERTCSTSTTIVVSINVHSTGLCMLVSILPPWTSLLHWWYPREMIYTTSGMVLMVLSFQRDSAGSLPA